MILHLVPDLMFGSRIRSTAEDLGVEARPVRDLDHLADRIAEGTVRAVLVDLEANAPDPLEVIACAKQRGGAACRVVAFGPHVDDEAFEAARDRGADETIPRSRFASTLPALLQRLDDPETAGSD